MARYSVEKAIIDSEGYFYYLGEKKYTADNLAGLLEYICCVEDTKEYKLHVLDTSEDVDETAEISGIGGELIVRAAYFEKETTNGDTEYICISQITK